MKEQRAEGKEQSAMPYTLVHMNRRAKHRMQDARRKTHGQEGRREKSWVLGLGSWVFYFYLLPIVTMAILGDGQVLAQCAMCKTTVENSTNAASVANTLNTAILILLLPPVMIMSTIFVVAFRRKRVTSDE